MESGKPATPLVAALKQLPAFTGRVASFNTNTGADTAYDDVISTINPGIAFQDSLSVNGPINPTETVAWSAQYK